MSDGDEHEEFHNRQTQPTDGRLQQDSELPSRLEKGSKKKFKIRVLDLVVLGSVTLVLGAILLPNFIRARARGQLTACKSNLMNIGTALDMYSSDWSAKYPDSLDKLVPNYLKTIPECRAAGRVSYRAEFGPRAKGNVNGYEHYYIVECFGGNHTRVSVLGNYPAYDGITGLIERAND